MPLGRAVGVNPPGNNFGINVFHGPKARLGITAGGLAFVATGNSDNTVRAFDKDTGKLLWSQKLPAPSQGAPAIYEVDGRQFVAFIMRGSSIAYALPPRS